MLDLTDLGPAQAAALVEEANKLQSEHGDFPAAADVKKILPYLEAISQRGDENGDINVSPGSRSSAGSRSSLSTPRSTIGS